MRVKIASQAELPPGKGKVLEVAGQSVTVYNLEGRLEATASHHTVLHTRESFDCSQPGLAFDTFAEDSPARLRTGERRLRVWIEAQEVWLELPE
jgi:hypothetical protein